MYFIKVYGKSPHENKVNNEDYGLKDCSIKIYQAESSNEDTAVSHERPD